MRTLCAWLENHTVAVVVAACLLFAAARAGAEGEASASGSDEILLPRHPAPSPDGSWIAFSYQGDVWLVSSEGGEARRITAHPAYEGHPVWSPDGQWIAFASDRDGNDDVYVLPLSGGEVRRLTWHSDPDLPTDWTADGRAVVFESRRYLRDGENLGLFLVPLDGGMPLPILATGGRGAAVSPDGKRMAYARGGCPWWRRGYEGNGRYRLYLSDLEHVLDLSPRRETEDAPEISCTSPGILARIALRPEGRIQNLTELGRKDTLAADRTDADRTDPAVEIGNNTNPHWFPDGDHLLYLSEAAGVANLKILSVQDGSRAWLTRFEGGRLRFPALSRQGSLAAFEYEDGIYTVKVPARFPPPGSSVWPEPPPQPEPLRIRIPIDSKSGPIERVLVTGDAAELALSPDGEQFAFVRQGEIFVLKANKEEPFANRLTDSPARDHQIAWSPDSKSLVFVSDREGNRDIYQVRSTDEEEPRLARSLRLETTRLTRDPLEEDQPKFSPKGERIAFVRGSGTLMTMKADGSDRKVVVEGWSEIKFSWSPDGEWIVFARIDDDFNSDVWIVPADGHEAPHNISQHPGNDTSPYWSLDGKLIAFVSEREYLRQTDIWYVWLSRSDDELSKVDRLDKLSGEFGRANGSLTDEKKEDQKKEDKPKKGKAGKEKDEEGEDDEEDSLQVEVHIDFEDIHKRLRRLTTIPGAESEVLVSKEGKQFVFISDSDGKKDLWKVKWDGSELERLTKGGQAPSSLQFDKAQKKVFYLKSGGAISSVPMDGGETVGYPYEGEMSIDIAARRRFVFDEAWRAIDSEFYDGEFHGADWAAMRERYRPWALAASTHRDFHDVIRLMLGELNSSHQGISRGSGEWPAPPVPAAAGELGVLFDSSFQGPGIRIVHVIPKTPADRIESRLEAGEVILSLNGTPLGPEVPLERLLDRTVDKKVRLEVQGQDGKTREVVIRPIAASAFWNLLYDEEVEIRRRCVRERSGGRLAYLHIRSMGVGSLVGFERDLYAEAHGKEALLIDVRDNPGGWTADILLTSLMAGDHATTVHRGGGPGYPQDRRLLYAWVKPVVVLCDENSFSNAEIFSWAIRTLRRGVLVGQQTFGGVISTGETTLADGSSLRLPGRGWYSRLDGSNMEREGCMPDVVIENLPEEVGRGIDRQLERAIEEGLKQLR